jgi:branched-chain amino acid transport system substrate-binding protein
LDFSADHFAQEDFLPFRLLSLLLLVVLVASSATGCSSSSKTSSAITIGALLPLTGALASYGETSNAALADAVSAINSEGHGKLTLAVEDTGTDPAKSLDGLKALHTRGVRLVIGPYSSSEVKAVKAFADQNGIVLVSPLSTATTLAIPGDNIFRFTPDDEQEARAVAAVALADGIRTIVPVTRDDEGNRGLQTSMKATFEAGGGSVLPAVTYGANETDFATTVEALTTRLTDVKAPPATVGVYLTAFSEVATLFVAATDSTPLRQVKWYGSDSVAQSKDLIDNKTAAAFALAAGYPNPILGVSDDDRGRWDPVRARIKQKIGRDPDAFAFASYDAVVVAFRALTKSVRSSGVDSLKQALTATAAEYHGLTGVTVLNAAGDRASGNYDFWSVCSDSGQFVWVRTVTYTSSPAADGKGQVNHPETCRR